MKNYSKLILFGSFFFCKLAVSIEPHELLSQFKAMAEEARTEEIARLKQMVLLPREHSVVFPDDFNRDDWRHGKYRTDYQNCLNSWYDRITIDHIRIIYVDFNGKRLVNYLQLVNSSSCSRYFYCNEDENEKLLKELIENLPLDSKPEVSVNLSKKKRLHQDKYVLWAQRTIDDLYSVTINYRMIKKTDLEFDWSKKEVGLR